nr:hypothetical protein [Alphaproteobacteria bacterium]
GQELFEAAIADGALAMDDDIMPDRFSMFQPHQVNKKYAAWARHQGLKDAGRISMVTENLRIKELADELPASVSEYQRAGTVARVTAGKSDEGTPE